MIIIINRIEIYRAVSVHTKCSIFSEKYDRTQTKADKNGRHVRAWMEGG